MTLREQILTELWAYKDANDEQYGIDATDRIIAIIREAMLSEEAVDELVTLVAQGSRNPIAMMNARATVKSIIARLEARNE